MKAYHPEKYEYKKQMKIKLIDLGRNKITKIAEIDTRKGLVNDNIEDTLIGVASHYLMSRNIDVEETPKPGLYQVFAGFHAVGQIEIIEQ